MVEVDVKHSESNEDYQLLTKIPTCEFQVKTARKKNGQLVVHGASTDKIFKALEKLESKDLEPHSLFPLPMISKQAFIQVTGTSHNQIYIGGTLYTINFYPGRYCKLQRHISHSKWEIDGKRLASESVEETISPFVCQHLGAASISFHSYHYRPQIRFFWS
jgi:tRNA pseudouridine synthase 10